MGLIVARDMDSLQEALVEFSRAGQRVALVPTMGALHAGHSELVTLAAQHGDVVAASIFVNPRQFRPEEDFSRYPRSLEADIARLDDAGAQLVYAPEADDLYPEGYSISVSAGPMGTILCGASRPGHFDGVATIVAKLLLRFLPAAALFGEKDYQQLCVLRRMTADLDIPVDIIGVPTVREADGLALSSRNAYLTPQERIRAPKLHAAISAAGFAIHSGGITAAQALAKARADLEAAGFRPDYIELREEDTLEALEEYAPGARVLAAGWLGQTRLIDNIVLA